MFAFEANLYTVKHMKLTTYECHSGRKMCEMLPLMKVHIDTADMKETVTKLMTVMLFSQGVKGDRF